MSYPQPNADAYSVNGYQFFRLNTLLSSAGDIYESAQSALAIGLGPDSDISQVNVAYFDDQVPGTMMNQITIDPARSFVGRIDARNEVQYLPAGRPGRILIWSADLYDPNYVPTFADPSDTIVRVVPRLDVIEHFQRESSLFTRRADRVYKFQSYELTGFVNRIIVPTYGRKYGYAEVTNHDPVNTITWQIWGVNYGIGAAFHQEKILVSAALPPTAQVTANNFLGELGAGMFDAIVVSAFGDSMPMRIVLSDEP